MTANTERRPPLRKASIREDLVSGITRPRPAPEMGEGTEAQATNPTEVEVRARGRPTGGWSPSQPSQDGAVLLEDRDRPT